MQDDQQQTQPIANEPVPSPQAAPVADVPAEVEPSSGPAAAPAADSVWISREEYQRLKQAEAAQAKSSTKGPAKLFGGMQIATSSLAAVGLVLSLTMSQESTIMFAFAPASLIILALTGGFTLMDYWQAKSTGQIREHKVRNILMLIFAILCFAVPFVYPAIGLLFFLLVCGFGGCRGS